MIQYVCGHSSKSKLYIISQPASTHLYFPPLSNALSKQLINLSIFLSVFFGIVFFKPKLYCFPSMPSVFFEACFSILGSSFLQAKVIFLSLTFISSIIRTQAGSYLWGMNNFYVIKLDAYVVIKIYLPRLPLYSNFPFICWILLQRTSSNPAAFSSPFYFPFPKPSLPSTRSLRFPVS